MSCMVNQREKLKRLIFKETRQESISIAQLKLALQACREEKYFLSPKHKMVQKR